MNMKKDPIPEVLPGPVGDIQPANEEIQKYIDEVNNYFKKFLFRLAYLK